MRVASVGCFPGAWRRGSWHFQVASLHLQSSMDLSLSASHYFPFLIKRIAGSVCRPRSEAPCTRYTTLMSCVVYQSALTAIYRRPVVMVYILNNLKGTSCYLQHRCRKSLSTTPISQNNLLFAAPRFVCAHAPDHRGTSAGVLEWCTCWAGQDERFSWFPTSSRHFFRILS